MVRLFRIAIINNSYIQGWKRFLPESNYITLKISLSHTEASEKLNWQKRDTHDMIEHDSYTQESNEKVFMVI